MMHHEDIDETQIRLGPFNSIGASMSIFGKIMGAIFGTHAEAATPTPATEAVGGATSSSEAAAGG